MVRKTKQEAENTRRAILDAAIQVLLAKGIARTHVGDIACEAGLSRGAFYFHFSNKYDLLNAIWKDLIDKNDFVFQVTGGTDEFDPLGFLVEQLFIFFAKMPTNARRQRLFHLFLHEGILLQHDHQFHFDRKSFQRQRLKNLEILLRAAVNKRQLHASTDIYTGAIIIISYSDWLTAQYYQLIEDLNINKDVTFLINGLMHMIRFCGICHGFKCNINECYTK